MTALNAATNKGHLHVAGALIKMKVDLNLQEAEKVVESIYGTAGWEEEQSVLNSSSQIFAEKELIWVQSIHLSKLYIIQDNYMNSMKELLCDEDHQLIFGFLKEHISFEKRMFQKLHPAK